MLRANSARVVATHRGSIYIKDELDDDDDSRVSFAELPFLLRVYFRCNATNSTTTRCVFLVVICVIACYTSALFTAVFNSTQLGLALGALGFLSNLLLLTMPKMVPGCAVYEFVLMDKKVVADVTKSLNEKLCGVNLIAIPLLAIIYTYLLIPMLGGDMFGSATRPFVMGAMIGYAIGFIPYSFQTMCFFALQPELMKHWERVTEKYLTSVRDMLLEVAATAPTEPQDMAAAGAALLTFRALPILERITVQQRKAEPVKRFSLSMCCACESCLLSAQRSCFFFCR